MALQQRHGLFPRIIGKGDNARRLADLLIRMRSEATASADSSAGNALLALTPSPTVENYIIIDREVDFATVLLTQLTYDGLVDEVIGIQNSQAEVDPSIVVAVPPPSQSSSSSKPPGLAQQTQQNRKRKVQLDS